MLEVVALVAYEGGNIKDFLVAAVDSADDFDDWVHYTKRLIETKFVEPASITGLYPQVDYFVALLVPAVDAAGVDLARKSVREFVELLEKVQEWATFKPRGDIAKLYTRVIRDLQHGPDLDMPMSKLIAELEHKDVPMLGLIAIASRAGEDGLKNFRRSPCVPSICKGMGKSLDEFMGKIYKMEFLFPENIADLENYEKFMEQFGGASINLSRSVAGTVDIIMRRADEIVATGGKMEVRGFEIPHGIGNRDYDAVIRLNGVDHFFENKTWEDIDKAKGYLSGQIATVRESKRVPGDLTEPGQIVDDIINNILDFRAGKPGPKWDFSDPFVREGRMEFTEHVLNVLDQNPLAKKVITERAGMNGRYDERLVEDALIRIFRGEI